MSGRIVGVNGQVLSAPAEERADVSLDFFFPSSKKDDPRIQVLGHLAQVVIQMSMEAGIEEFCLRFHNSLLSSGLTVQPRLLWSLSCQARIRKAKRALSSGYNLQCALSGIHHTRRTPL
jgi:hypothetical protein